MNKKNIFEAVDLTKTYTQAGSKIDVLNKSNFSIESGTVNIIAGRSGSGKSTLLNILGGLDKQDSGEIFFKEEKISSFSETRMNKFRNESIGFVFQFHHLLADFTEYENILMPLKIYGNDTKKNIERVEEIIAMLGIENRKNHFPSQLSGGEQQRTAIARSLANNPDVLLADEPTGNLDNKTAADVMELFWKINSAYGTTVIIVTHDISISAKASNLYEIKNHNVVKNGH